MSLCSWLMKNQCYVSEGVGRENERLSNPIENWTISARHSVPGQMLLNCLPITIPDASPETLKHQTGFCASCWWTRCEKQDLPFLLEIGELCPRKVQAKSVGFGKAGNLTFVIRSVEEFTDPSYKVDILKLEFPR